jgi:hypothetical protein
MQEKSKMRNGRNNITRCSILQWPAWSVRRSARLVLLTIVAVASSAATKGPDAGGYTASDAVVYSLVDISGTGGGASVLGGIDDGVAALTLPFSFQFYGHAYTSVCASANGALYFVDAASACSGFNDFANTDLTSTATPNDLAAALPFWTDLTFQVPGAGAVFYQTLGVPGGRRFIVQWNNAYPQGSPNPVTFQVVLTEGTNRILFQYQTVGLGGVNPASNGGQATVGIRNAGGLTSQQQIEWSFDAPVIADNSALVFAPAKVIGDVNGDGVVNCTDLAIVRASLGKRAGQAGFDPRADLNGDGVVNLVDLAIVSRAFPIGTKCP